MRVVELFALCASQIFSCLLLAVVRYRTKTASFTVAVFRGRHIEENDHTETYFMKS